MDKVKSYLEIHTWARDRVNKDVAILNILATKYPFMKELPTRIITDFVREYSNHDRYWRWVTRDNPELRGKDYDDKAQLEFNTQQHLGYESGYHQLKDKFRDK